MKILVYLTMLSHQTANKKWSRIWEICLGIFILLSLLIYVWQYADIIRPANFNPFKEYYSNRGIEIIYIIDFIARIIFLVMLYLSVFKERNSQWQAITYLISAFIIGFLQWFELYYGSTFYYGEVRDKQGLYFPLLASIMFTLIIWKINYSTLPGKDFAIKLILTTIINIALYLLWQSVQEPWSLRQS